MIELHLHTHQGFSSLEPLCLTLLPHSLHPCFLPLLQCHLF
jgi:hypothetical protein